MMSATAVRIPPLSVDELTPEQMKLIGGWHHLVFSRVLVRHPGMYATFLPFLAEVITKTSLPPKDREIVCLRMLRLCGDVYEHTHHITIAQRCGMTGREIEDASEGEGATLTPADMDVVHATEELFREQRICDATWAALGKRYSQQQLMELVFLAGCYQTMGMLTRTFDMQLETDAEDHERINALRTYK
jgi:alkylhydroperoxidase family enzyme